MSELLVEVAPPRLSVEFESVFALLGGAPLFPHVLVDNKLLGNRARICLRIHHCSVNRSEFPCSVNALRIRIP